MISSCLQEQRVEQYIQLSLYIGSSKRRPLAVVLSVEKGKEQKGSGLHCHQMGCAPHKYTQIQNNMISRSQ
jgi:hypothetical protein